MKRFKVREIEGRVTSFKNNLNRKDLYLLLINMKKLDSLEILFNENYSTPDYILNNLYISK